ncbi:Crp/Fnr family transcriptional regulator, partial [Paracoccus benzoatiresistens]
MSEVYASGGNGDSQGKRLDLAPFSRLAPDTLHLLERICQVRSYPAGQSVLVAGDTAAFVGFVQSGILRMQKLLPDGRRHIVALLMDGDMFGRIFDGPMPYAIEAAADSKVLCFRRDPFERLILQ